MKRLLLALTLALGLTVFAATSAFAANGSVPSPGPDFAQCVTMMAQNGMTQAMTLGSCVSGMAQGFCSTCAAVTA